MTDTTIIDHLATLAAKHKIVPFLGAGCSYQHLRSDWDSICAEMSTILGIPNTDNKKIAQEFVNQRGREEFCKFLKTKLQINQFEDNLGECHLLIMSLYLGVVYTTNQDNVMERCLQKHGREYRQIVKLEDLGESKPGDALYVKFHGDLDVPGSIVFTDDDFRDRIAEIDNFLNIRLRADLLAKSLLFVGYSLRDPNMYNLLNELQTSFKGRLPNSYLIAFQASPDLERRCQELGIQTIIPRTIFPDSATDEEAFLRFLSELVRRTSHKKERQAFEGMFAADVPASRRVLTKYDVGILKSMNAMTFDERLARFRGLVDSAYIPEEYQKDVSDVFCDIAKQCSNEDGVLSMKGSALNLHLTKPDCLLNAMSAVVATLNCLDKNKGMRIFHYHPHMNGYREDLNILAAAASVEWLTEWGREITDSLRHYITHSFDFGIDFQTLPPNIQDYIYRHVAIAWSRPTGLENPIARQARLKDTPLKRLIPYQSRDQLEQVFLNSFPRKLRKPYED